MLEWIGRGEAELKIRGNRIGSREVERELESINGIDAAVVVARSFEGQGEEMLAAYIVVSRPFDKDQLHQMLSQQLPAYMIPDLYIVLSGFPLLPNGKFDRSNLPAPSRDNTLSSERRALEPSVFAPVSLQEHRLRVAQICQVFAQLLGREHFDHRDDFFDLGETQPLW
ncbi:AMP-binding enzyme [Pseudomonas sp. S2_A02]